MNTRAVHNEGFSGPSPLKLFQAKGGEIAEGWGYMENMARITGERTRKSVFFGVSQVKQFEMVRVECYAGYKRCENPRVLVRNGRRIRIEEVLDRWVEGGVSRRAVPQDCFRVLTAEGDVVLLRYSLVFDRWTLEHRR